MSYMAECVGGCASFKGDTGNVWVSEYHLDFIHSATAICSPYAMQRSTRMLVSCPIHASKGGSVLTSFGTDNGNRGSVPWGENVIRVNTQFYNVTVPAGLKAGEYIIRHEVSFSLNKVATPRLLTWSRTDPRIARRLPGHGRAILP